MTSAFFSQGKVGHARIGLRENTFRYPIFSFLFRCDQEVSVIRNLRRKFWGVLDLRSKDYLDGRMDSFDTGIHQFLKERCGYVAEEVWLQTFPRMLGYVFNPVSFWFCKKQGQLDAVLVEVNNTFGERHFYWLNPAEGMIKPNRWFRAEKVFHVSPFYSVDGYYEFRFQLSEISSRIDINYFSAEGKIQLITWIEGKLRPFENQKVISLFLKYGWMTPLVVFRIHWQAFILWRKKVPFYRKPVPPSKEVT